MNLTLNNFLSTLKNSSLIQKETLTIKYNNSFLPILKVLYKEGFILSYTKIKQELHIKFRYYYNFSNLKNLKIISTISKPIYLTSLDILKIYEKDKILVFSTSKGILTSLECKKLKIGGKLIFMC